MDNNYSVASSIFFFVYSATSVCYTLSLHDALPILVVYLPRGPAHVLDQALNALQTAVEFLCQGTKLIPTGNPDPTGHVTGGHLAHHQGQLADGLAGGEVETQIQPDDQYHDHRQRRHQQGHRPVSGAQALVQCLLQMVQHGMAEVIDLEIG